MALSPEDSALLEQMASQGNAPVDMAFEPEPDSLTSLAAPAPAQNAAPDPGKAAERYEPEGALYGHDSDVADPRSGLERLRGMWASRPQQAPIDVPDEAGPAAPDNAQWRTAFILNGLMGRDHGDLINAYNGQKKAYEDHVAAQHAKAAGAGLVDQATAEQLVLMGVSPEAALNMTKDSAALQLAKASPYLARGYRQDDLKNDQHITGELGKDVRGEQDNAVKLEVADRNNAGRVAAAKARKKGGGTGAGGPAEPVAIPAATLSGHAEVPMEMAEAFLAGNLEGIPEDALLRMKRSAGTFSALDPKKAQDALKGSFLHEQNAPDALQAKKDDPAQRTKIRTELAETFRDIQGASKGWQSLSDRARNAAVKLALGGKAMDAALNPQEQTAVANVVSLLNGFIRKMSGAAVSDSEGGRVFAGAGFSPDFNPWKSPAVVGDFLKRMQRSYADRHRIVAQTYGGQL